MSEKRDLTFGSVLNVLLTDTNCRSSYFANHYVYKDASLVSKWLHGTQFPTSDVFPLIVRFAMEQSNAAMRSIMRIEIDRYVSCAGLDDSTMQTLSGIPDFDSYLLGVLNVLANLKKTDRTPTVRTDGTACASRPAAGIAAPDGGAVSHPESSVNTAPHRLAASSADIACAAFSALCGETIWRLAAAALRLSPATGALGGVAGGWSLAWGLALTLPAMSFAMLSLDSRSPFIRTLTFARKLAFLGCYGAAGGIAGLLLGSAGLFDAAPPPAVPPLALVLVCSLILSFIPLLSVYALLRRPAFDVRTFLLLEFGPCLICTFVATPFMLQEATRQAGDIFSGYVLGLSMYCSVRAVLQSHPGKIRLRIFDPDASRDR